MRYVTGGVPSRRQEAMNSVIFPFTGCNIGIGAVCLTASRTLLQASFRFVYSYIYVSLRMVPEGEETPPITFSFTGCNIGIGAVCLTASRSLL